MQAHVKEIVAPSLIDRELSWLEFNARVLQEAADPSVPLTERLRFMGIFASNLDEFFRVRVASLRSLLRLKKKRRKKLHLAPTELLTAIHDVVAAHDASFRRIFEEDLVPELARRGVILTDDRHADEALRARAATFFDAEVKHLVKHLDIEDQAEALENGTGYLVVELLPEGPIQVARSSPDIALIRLPTPPLRRFVEFANDDGTRSVMFLDDVVRLHLADLFPARRVLGAWAFEISRDAGLYLEGEFEGDIVAAIRKSLSKRKNGALTRFLYDPEMPAAVLRALEEALDLEPEDLVEGGRYHNLRDLVDFPGTGRDEDTYPEWAPVPHPALSKGGTVADVVSRSDQLLHFPYQSFDHVERFLTEAAVDPEVVSIRMSIYRVSAESPVLQALLSAADKGKDVRVFVEAKARGDEESNLEWAERLEERGILTYYSFRDLKVHAKVALVVRNRGGETTRQAYLGTGNFNEVTARFYADFALLTGDCDLTREVEAFFNFLEGHDPSPRFEHLIVAPFGLRERFQALIEAERERALNGEPASILFKVNGLEDSDMIDRLRLAALDGVEVRGIVRGICRWAPDAGLWGDRVHLRSIVDRYLEHGRAYVFGNGGDPLVYLGSADWMYRNLSRRAEVVFPIRDPECRAQVLHILSLQLSDNRKARVLSAGSHNRLAEGGPGTTRAQEATYRWLESSCGPGLSLSATGGRSNASRSSAIS